MILFLVFIILQGLNELLSLRFFEAWYTCEEEMKRDIDRGMYEFESLANEHIKQVHSSSPSSDHKLDRLEVKPEISSLVSKPVVSSISGTGAESLFQELQNTFSERMEEEISSPLDEQAELAQVDESGGEVLDEVQMIDFSFDEVLCVDNTSYESPEEETIKSDVLNELDKSWVTNAIEVYDQEEEKKRVEQEKIDRKSEELKEQIRKLQESDEESAHENSVRLLYEYYKVTGEMKERIVLKKRYPELFISKLTIKPEQNKETEQKRVALIGGIDESELHLPPAPQSLELSNIKDKKFGEQVWYGQVIGVDRKENGMYFHFRDRSQREWLQFNKHKVEVGDILVVKVRVTPNRILVKNVFKWKAKSINKVAK